MKRGKIKDIRGAWRYIIMAIPIIIVIAAVYITQLHKTVSDNIEQNISELAEHDLNSITDSVESAWQELDNIKKRFDVYQCDSLDDMEEQMNLECASSTFTHLYMVAEDGRVYTDNFLIYEPDGDSTGGRMDLLSYFHQGEEHVVSRYDDKGYVTGKSSQYILYGLALEDFVVQDISMAGLVGITDLANIQGNMTISSFVKNGVSRGYSGVIDMDGNYVVSVEGKLFVDETEDFFEKIDTSSKSDFTSKQVSGKMQEGESFFFYLTAEDGEQRVVYCKPFEVTGIHWYFLLSVEEHVFSEQNRMFLTMSMAMLISVVLVVIATLVILMVFMRKAISVRAQASARSDFLANMSHEIRTPLNGIIGLLFLMKQDLANHAGEQLIMQRLDKATDTADYLLSLINNVLSISKLQAGKVDLAKDVLSTELLMDDICAMQRGSMEAKGIDFVVEKDISVPWFIGDEVIIKQVLMNIVSNAVKFTPSGGKITFSVSQKQEESGMATNPATTAYVATTFICRDTGCGMGEDFQKHIWDNFSQERESNEKSIKGTGLGMAISKHLVDAMGAQIRVESTPGEGSTFLVTLHSPMAKEPQGHLQDTLESRRQSAQRPLKIMVVEDNELNAEILLEILESNGFEVIHAENGQLAVEKFQASQVGEIDMILMDMQMPVLDGCDATRAIRSLERPDAEQVPIFACTANNFSEDRERAEESGMDDFLSKPIDINTLLKKLKNITVHSVTGS